MRRFAVQQRESTTHKRIPQPSEPAGLLAGERSEMPTYSFNKHQLTQAREHALATCAFVGGFGDGEPHKLAEPAVFESTVVAHHHDTRQGCKQGIERAHIAAEKPADKPKPFRSGSLANDVIGPLFCRPNPAHIELGASGYLWISAHDVRIAARKNDNVAGIEPHRLAPLRNHTTVTFSDKMI